MIGKEINSKIAEKCFNQELKTLLEFRDGDFVITVEDELNDRYGELYVRFTEKQMLREAKKIIIHNWDLIEKIKLRTHYFKALNPDFFAINVKDTTVTANIQKSDAEGKTKTNDISISNVSSISAGSQTARTLANPPTSLEENLENSIPLNTLPNIEAKRKNFQNSFDNENFLITAETITTPPRQAATGNTNTKYHSTAFARNSDISISTSNSNNESRNLTVQDTKTTSAGCNHTTTTTTTDTVGESVLKAYDSEIKGYFEEFWTYFSVLYTDEKRFCPYYVDFWKCEF